MRLYLLVLLANLSFLNAETLFPTFFPTVVPTFSQAPTVSSAPTEPPTVRPTRLPTVRPTRTPTQLPTAEPSIGPSAIPTVAPTILPTRKPTVIPTIHPTQMPTEIPTIEPSHHPTIDGKRWLVESYHVNETSAALVAYGTRTQQCMSFYSGEGDVWYMFSCGDDYIQFQMYSDSECTNAIHQDDINIDFAYETGSGVYFGYEWSFEYGYGYSRLPEVGFVSFSCSSDGAQYDFLEYDPSLKYAVTEFFQEDSSLPEDENDEFYQCHVPFTQFAAYQKGYCFHMQKGYYFEETFSYDDYYMKFSASDSTFLSFTYFSDETCSYDSDEYYVANIFAVDDCKQNGFQGSYYYDVSKKDFTPADASPRSAEIAAANADAANNGRNAKKGQGRSNAFNYDKTTPTALRKIMTESYARAQGKPVVTYVDALNSKVAAKKAERLAKRETNKKDAQGIEDGFDDAIKQKPFIYFTDDAYYFNYYWQDDDDNVEWDDDQYYNDFLPMPDKFHALSEYYLWKNVPDLTVVNPPKEWLTEIIYNSEETAVVAQTRKTLTCLPYTKNGWVYFNYKVMCENHQVHIMYYGWYDINCEEDYRISSWNEMSLFSADDPSNVGENKFYWDFDYAEIYCSDTRFSDNFDAAMESNTYATELFFPVTGLTEDDYYFESECTVDAEGDKDANGILGVAIIQDYCFNLNVDYVTEVNNDYESQERTMSVKYWVDEEDNNQNIQFGVWESPECNSKFLHQTKEIEINECYAHQPNWWYNEDVYQEAAQSKNSKKSAARMDTKAAQTAVLGQFTHHDTMGTPFAAKVFEHAPKTFVNHAQKHVNKKTAKSAKKATKSAEKKSDALNQGYYYYYNDDANTVFNNRDSAMKNMWFSMPTTATIPPSEVPTVAPSEQPSLHPSVLPTIAPSQVPSEMPTIEPTMSPLPPTLRPTPGAGFPTASPTHQVTYTFSVDQTVNGINASTFLSNENNTLAFREAVAMGIPPLTSDNVEISEVVDVEEVVRKLRGLTISEESSVIITYWITYRVAETGYNDAETAYSALISSLTTAIVDTDLFEGYITVTDAKYPSDLLGTTTSEFEASEDEQIGTDDDSKPNTRSYYKTIVGVVLGLGGGLLVIGVIYMCIFGPLSTRKNESA